MSANPDQLYTAAASRAIDANAIVRMPVDGLVLMQRAADAAFDCLLRHFPGAGSLTVLCGKGNNAGDAYLVARRAYEYGLRVQLLAVVDPDELSGDAALAHRVAMDAGLDMASAAEEFVGDVIVDGLLGTGIRGAPRSPYEQAIERANASGKPVLAIDVPSGVNADTGAVAGAAIRAAVTISFITRKIGIYTGAAVSLVGEREFADLGVADNVYDQPGVPLLRWRHDLLPALPVTTYKHRQGHLVIAGGDLNMPGAVAMAAEAALRAGAGMVTVVTHGAHTNAIVARIPEVMVVDAQSELAKGAIERADLLVLGPGLGRTAWGEALFETVEQAGKLTVVDADGLFQLAQRGRWQGGDLVITPHAAEAARLLNCPVAELQADRLASASALAQGFDCIGVLKGAGSVMFDRSGAAICGHGNPGMATAGMGDVLSGVLGGLLAELAGQGALDQALCYARLQAAVILHSAAADLAAQRVGERSLLATDVTRALPELLRSPL